MALGLDAANQIILTHYITANILRSKLKVEFGAKQYSSINFAMP